MLLFRPLFHLLLLASAAPVLAAETRTRYDHGDPTPNEQYMLELINRARSNPTAEGEFLHDTRDAGIVTATRYFKVDLDRMREDFASYPARPPLAFNPKLMRSSRTHSEDMVERNFQGHDSSDGTSFVTRIAETAYPYSAIAENVYSLQVSDPLYAHAGFNIDWGDGPGGMQPALGHRLNIMNYQGSIFREIGISVVARTGSSLSSYGKLSITQDFGLNLGGASYLLGVVYKDSNHNDICDPGEGMAGVTVSPSVGNYYAITSRSGGYAIPFKSPATGVLTFSGGGLNAAQTLPFSIGGENLKIDLDSSMSAAPRVSLEVTDNSARETAGSAKFLIRRNVPGDDALTVVIRRSKGGSRGKADSSDYKLSGGGIRDGAENSRDFSIIIPAGKSAASIRLKAVNDRIREPKETVTFSIRPTSRYQIDKQAPGKIFITR